MRSHTAVGRRLLAVAAATILTAVGAAPAAAQEGVNSDRFETYCTPSDAGLEELSGLTVVDGVTYAIGDGGTDLRLAALDDRCAVARWIDVPVDPYDVEDLASYGGDLWLSDTGDNQRQRPTVALTRIDPADGTGELYRLTYPDGPHDAESLLIEPGGRPVVVTKEPLGVSGLYVPAGDATVDELSSPGPTPLVRVGQITFEATTTPGGPPILVGSILATGGAVSVDGTVAALRTYTDLYLYAVENGDVVGALTSEPVVVPLPDQPQGEAVAFDAQGNLLVASEAAGGPLPPILVLPDAAALVRTTDAPAEPEATATNSAPTDSTPTDNTTTDSAPTDTAWVVGALSVVGVALLASITYGVRSALRRR